MLRFSLFISLAFIPPARSHPVIRHAEDCFARSPASVRVFLTVSSLPASTTRHGIVRRRLEVNWVGPARTDRILVYRQDPERHPAAKPVLSLDPSQHPGGYYRTDIELSIRTHDLSVSEPCLGYWATYGAGASSCLRTQPRWMGESAAQLGELQLSQIMIPGSHDSGSFIYRDEKELFSRYKYAQELSIFNQLVHGLRYFDLRVGCYKGSFYINHSFLRTEHTVTSVLQQVQKFLQLNPKEVVILDFHNFPHGFHSNAVHLKLQNLIMSVLGLYLIPSTDQFENATFKDLWRHQKSVLVSYDSSTRQLLYPDAFWPGIPRAWGNKQNAKDLKAYFVEFFEQPTPRGLWASMAEITPNTRSILLHPEKGLRVLAEEVNKNVTHWFRDLYWQKANIVATDYFLGNDIIDVAIRTNRIKGVCPEKLWSSMSP